MPLDLSDVIILFSGIIKGRNFKERHRLKDIPCIGDEMIFYESNDFWLIFSKENKWGIDVMVAPPFDTRAYRSLEFVLELIGSPLYSQEKFLEKFEKLAEALQAHYSEISSLFKEENYPKFLESTERLIDEKRKGKKRKKPSGSEETGNPKK